MLLRGMHDHGCDDIFIIVTDMKRSEMDMATEYFKLVCGHTFGPTLKQSAEREIHYQRTSASSDSYHRWSLTILLRSFVP